MVKVKMYQGSDYGTTLSPALYVFTPLISSTHSAPFLCLFLSAAQVWWRACLLDDAMGSVTLREKLDWPLLDASAQS